MLLGTYGVLESAMSAEAAEKWKHLFKWDEASETIVYSRDWLRPENRLLDNGENKELMAYKISLEKKMDDAREKHWKAFKLRPEANRAADLSAEEVVRLEKKWSCKGLICYDAKLFDPVVVHPAIDIWDADRNPYHEYWNEISILRGILNARKDADPKETAVERELSKAIDQFSEDWGAFLDTRVPKGANATVINALKARRRILRNGPTA